MADIRVGTGVSNGTLLGVTTSFPFEYAYEKGIYMMYRRPGKIPAGAVKWYRWNNPSPGWNYISQCTWNYGGQYYDYIYCGCSAGTGRYKVTFAGLSREYTVASAGVPKACLYGHEPNANKNVIVGTKVPIKHSIKNCGDVRGYFYGSLYVDEIRKVLFDAMLDPRQVRYRSSADYVMPNKTINVVFKAYAYRDGWKKDVDVTYTLTPIEQTHDTALSIAITDEAGNPITKSVIGEIIYITGQLRDIVDNVALQGASIALYRNGVATGKTDITNASGIYSIPYTVTSADVPTVRFKTVFGGTQ